MSKFYGTVQGGRGRATRCGHISSGITASAQSFEGSVVTSLYLGGEGKVHARIMVTHGSASYGGAWLYDGPIEPLLTPAGRLALLRRAAVEPFREAAE